MSCTDKAASGPAKNYYAGAMNATKTCKESVTKN
jgi:hypothetical protein